MNILGRLNKISKVIFGGSPQTVENENIFGRYAKIVSIFFWGGGICLILWG